jgi:flagellar motility protein MotE (MotC chaperone)
MKSYILNSIPFLFAFVIVTGAIIYLNGQYNNIFQFDFTPRNLQTVSIKDSVNTADKDKPKAKVDSLTATNDSIKVDNPLKDSVQVASLVGNNITEPTELKTSLKDVSKKELETQVNKKPDPEKDKIEPKFVSDELNRTQDSKQQKQDSTYQNWLKKVSKLLEQMEPSKASKIIQNYSDNVARDIIYTMNKKSAAKIVSELNPEIAQRIIRYD